MQAVSFKRHRFPQRGIETNYETIRCWALKFGRLFAQNLRRSRPKPTGRWHLDEMVVKISGKRMWLWRAVDDEGEVLDVLVQKRRDTAPTANMTHDESGRYRACCCRMVPRPLTERERGHRLDWRLGSLSTASAPIGDGCRHSEPKRQMDSKLCCFAQSQTLRPIVRQREVYHFVW